MFYFYKFPWVTQMTYCIWSLSVVVHRPSSQLLPILVWSISMVRGYKNCEMYGSIILGAPQAGLNIYKKNKSIFQKSSSLLYTYEETIKCMVIMFIMPSTDIVNFMAPVSRIQALGWDQFGHIVKIYQILESIFLYSVVYL